MNMQADGQTDIDKQTDGMTDKETDRYREIDE
jgi:hypothetical protein